MNGTGDLEERLIKLDYFLTQDPDNLKLLHECIDLNLQLGKLDAAQLHVDSAKASYPNDLSVLFSQSKVYLGRLQFDRALHVLEQITESGVDNVGVTFNKAWALLNLNRFDETVSTVDANSSNTVEQPYLSVIKARALHNLLDYQGAIEELRKFIDKNSNNAEATGFMSLLLLDTAQYTEAKSTALKALDIEPQCSDALVTMSTLLVSEQEPDDALRYINANPRTLQESGRMQLNLGQVHMLNLEIPEALETFKKAAELMPTHIGTWHMVAWAQIMLGMLDEAKSSFDQAMDIDRNFGDTHGGLAVVSVMKGEIEPARKLIKTALRLDPMSASARYADSLISEREGNAQEAEAKIQAIYTSSTGASDVPVKELIKKAQSRLNIKPH